VTPPPPPPTSPRPPRTPRPSKPPACALDAAKRLLARQQFTAHQLARRLQRRFEAPAVAAAVKRAAALGLLDDRACADSLIRVMLARGWGQARMAQRLAAVGIDAPIARAALAEALSNPEVDPLAAARRFALRRAAAARTKDTPARAASKLIAALVRRGHRYSAASALAREAFAAAGKPWPDPE
jgi:SOS response regulatory protein OraA/RecX